jgi:hypothetical protein
MGKMGIHRRGRFPFLPHSRGHGKRRRVTELLANPLPVAQAFDSRQLEVGYYLPRRRRFASRRRRRFACRGN